MNKGKGIVVLHVQEGKLKCERYEKCPNISESGPCYHGKPADKLINEISVIEMEQKERPLCNDLRIPQIYGNG